MDLNQDAAVPASNEMPDPKIGTIVVSIQTGDSQDSACVKKEVRDVFASKYFADRPYYLTNTANRIYVMDKTRIQFFPNGESTLEKIASEIKRKEREEAKERAKRIITEKCDRDELQDELDKQIRATAEALKGEGVGHCGAAGRTADEDDEGSGNQDPKIGTILMRKLGGGDRAANTPEDEDECLEMERRYVLASAQCQNEPYYLSMTGNRIFVVDKRRIEYFPNGVEPESIKEEMLKWATQVEMCKKRRADAAAAVEEAVQAEQVQRERQEEEDKKNAAEREEMMAEEKKRNIKPVRTGDPSRIGTIKVQIGKESAMFYPDPDEDGTVTLDVFSNLRFEKPYYLTYTGNRILVVDQSRITLDNPPPTKKNRRPVYI